MPDIKKYTHAQVKEHNNENDVWLVINEKVYDVTKFLKEVSFLFSFLFISLHEIVLCRNDHVLISFFEFQHPGGEEVLIAAAGTDGNI